MGLTLPVLAFMRFETPGYLALLALVPVLVLLSFQSLSGLGPWRRAIAIATRCAVVGMMILALAGAQSVQTTDALTVIALVDRSDSIPRAQQQEAFEYLRNAAKTLRPTKDRLAIIAFNGHAAIEQLPQNALGIERLAEPIDGAQTDLSAALRMSLALFPADSARRVVLFSDGNENSGAALEEAERLAGASTAVDILPIRYEHADEVVFDRLVAPPTAATEETINLRMTLRSQKRVNGRILVYHNDQLLDLDPRDRQSSGHPVQLEPGPNALVIPIPLRDSGAHRFRATFEPEARAADSITGNNEGRAFTVVAGPGRVLILTQGGAPDTEDDLESARLLAAALEREKLLCDVEVVNSQPIDQVRLLEYAAVILANVPAGEFSEETRQALAVYVRDLGGGLVMLGGDESFGAGGWMDTPVEEVMPVSFDVKSRKEIPKGALVLVMHACEIPEGNFIGERAAVAAVKTLSSRDLVGVLSYKWQGADRQYWDVPFQSVGDKGRIINMVKAMQMGDLPDFDPLMRQGVEALIKRSDAAAKHMIIVSDFDPAPPRDDLVTMMKTHKISCSTVAVGFGSHPIDVNKAAWIAQETGGKFYSTKKYSEVPQIFIKESRVVRRSLINEGQFTPRLTSSSSTLLEGLQGEPIPRLGGLVLTTKRELAQAPLVRRGEDGDDPVLAHWQVGLGRTVAFTSGMWQRWGRDWSAWPGFSKVWAQVIRWVSRPPASSAFDVSTTVEGGRGKIRLDARDKNASAINFMSIEGALVSPSFESQQLQLTQIGPGQYEADFDARDAGSYVVSLAYQAGVGDNATSGSLQTGVSVAFSPEYRELKTNEWLLNELAQRTGGRLLNWGDPAAAFDLKGLRSTERRSSIWESLIRYVLLLFLIDVAVRRVALNPIDWARKARRWLSEVAGGRAAAESSAAVLTTLRGARERAREGQGPASRQRTEAGPAPSRGAKYEAQPTAGQVNRDLNEALGGATEQQRPVVAPPTRKPPPAAGDFTSRLLKAKQKARENIDSDDSAKSE